MAGYTERDVEECACLHKQITDWVLCAHVPRHQDLADAIVQFLRTRDPETRRGVRGATAGRRRGAPAKPSIPMALRHEPK